MSGESSDTQSSSPEQFAAGDTLVECHAGTGKTTRLIEWVREQHDDEAVRMFIDPAADTLPEAVEGRRFTPFSIDPRHATYKYSVSDGHPDQPDDEEGPP